jgi:UDP-N-acetylmuramoyl-tripeptide--D-alanyl-D-alanine ligase
MEIQLLYDYYLSSRKVCTDTRQITPGCLFFALKGQNFNGNHFAAEALAKGAAYAVIDEVVYKTDEHCILVDNTLAALQDLARFHRRQLRIPVIGITGSNGKTTNKELIYAVLSRKYNTFATQGNLNNHIGVPLTLLGMDEKTEIGVVEMGANHQGEIKLLSGICEPSHGMITNIGKAHLEGFGGIEGVKKGKGELYNFLFATGGKVFINSRDLTLMKMLGERLEKIKTEVIHFPAKGDFLHLELLQADPFIAYEDEAGQPQTTQLTGSHNFMNLAAALCFGKYFGVPMADACAAIREYVPENNRSQWLQKGSNTILLDAYNANPSSMEVALRAFAGLKAGRKVVILGDMYELGEESETEHRRLGELLAELGFETVFLVGKQMQAAAVKPRFYYFPDKFSLNNYLMDRKLEDSHILLKASRGMSLETVVALL